MIPMLCESVTDLRKFILPSWVSRKLNGIRAIWTGEHFVTRQGKVWRQWATERIFKTLPQTPLDGEFYVEGLELQEITERCGVQIIRDPGLHFEYHVYDMIVNGVVVGDRMKWLKQHVPVSDTVKLHESHQVNTLPELEAFIHKAQEQKWEGIVGRYSVYLGGQSAMQKYKFMYDEEVTVCDFVEGKGKFRGMLGALVVRDSCGRIFEIGGGKMTDRDRLRVWIDKDQYRGKLATIRFPSRSKDNVPQQAVFIAWRNYE